MGNFAPVNLYFQDESRFGLFTRNGKYVTAIRVMPICTFQQVFKSTWLSGALLPITGWRSFLVNITTLQRRKISSFFG